MEFNKDHVIYLLFISLVVLITYILLEEPVVQTVTKTEYKTIVKEKVVYKEQECPDVVSETLLRSNTPNNSYVREPEKIVQDNEYTLTTANDNQYMYSVSLVSSMKPLKSKTFKRVILNGRLTNDEYKSIFILEFNRTQVDDSGNLLLKVTDRANKTVYVQYNPCLSNLMENRIYKVELDISSGEVVCLAEEERVLTAEENKPLIKNQVKNIKPDHVFNLRDFNKS